MPLGLLLLTVMWLVTNLESVFQVKFQVDGLCEQLRRSKIHFVHCFLPQHNAGLCDVKGVKKTQNSDEILMNVPLVRSQVSF